MVFNLLYNLKSYLLIKQGIFMNKNTHVTIYTSSLCGYCYKAKLILNSKNIKFEEIDIDLDIDIKNKMIERTKGKTSVPQIFFDNLLIGGFDDLQKMDVIGKLIINN